MANRMTLDNRTAVITGAASGIGRATALAAAREGALLFLTDLNPESLQAVDWIEVTPEEAEQVGCNVCVLDAQRLVIASQQIGIRRELEAHGIQTFPIDYDAVTALGGSLRCSHHPILRVSG